MEFALFCLLMVLVLGGGRLVLRAALLLGAAALAVWLVWHVWRLSPWWLLAAVALLVLGVVAEVPVELEKRRRAHADLPPPHRQP